jgi:hypothetical protein
VSSSKIIGDPLAGKSDCWVDEKWCRWPDSNRHGPFKAQRILSPLRLPFRHIGAFASELSRDLVSRQNESKLCVIDAGLPMVNQRLGASIISSTGLIGFSKTTSSSFPQMQSSAPYLASSKRAHRGEIETD